MQSSTLQFTYVEQHFKQGGKRKERRKKKISPGGVFRDAHEIPWYMCALESIGDSTTRERFHTVKTQEHLETSRPRDLDLGCWMVGEIVTVDVRTFWTVKGLLQVSRIRVCCRFRPVPLTIHYPRAMESSTTHSSARDPCFPRGGMASRLGTWSSHFSGSRLVVLRHLHVKLTAIRGDCKLRQKSKTRFGEHMKFNVALSVWTGFSLKPDVEL